MSLANPIISSITCAASIARFWYFRTACSSISAKDFACTTFLRDRTLISPVSNFRNNSTARFFCGIPRTSARNSSERIERSGFLSPAAAKMSTISSDTTAFEIIWRMAWSSSSSVFCSPGVLFASTERTAWKNPTSSRIRNVSSCGTANAKACESSVTARRRRAFPSCCFKICSCAAGKTESRSCGLPVIHGDQSKPVTRPAGVVYEPKRPRQISYFSSITATASAWSIAVLPVPPLSV